MADSNGTSAFRAQVLKTLPMRGRTEGSETCESQRSLETEHAIQPDFCPVLGCVCCSVRTVQDIGARPGEPTLQLSWVDSVQAREVGL